MDVEARKKYCGLLMFPTGPPSSRNNDTMSMREVDPSSSTFESSRMMNNSLDHQFVMQDGFGEYSASSRALAAGAAAGGDFINQDMETPNMIDGDTSAKSQPAKRTPRPPNAFILYRRAKQPAIIASQRNLTNAEVSRTISDMWKKEPEEIRLEWERFADRKKLEHMQTYPNYVYRPNKNKSKVDKRRQQRRQTASKDSPNSSNNNNNNLAENKSSTNQGGPVRRKSTKSVSSKQPTKLDLPIPINGMTGYMQQQQQQTMNQQTNSNTDTSNSYTTILPSPEIPLLSTHFTENPEEFVSHPVTPITPLTPPEHDYKVQNRLLQELTYQQHHQNQGNTPQFFQSIPLTSFPNAPNPLEFCCFVPDVEQQQQQMIAEMMLHHDQHHHITPTATVPSSNPASTVQYYSSGGGTFTEMLGFDEFPFLGGSVNHNSNGLDSSDQYLQ